MATLNWSKRLHFGIFFIYTSWLDLFLSMRSWFFFFILIIGRVRKKMWAAEKIKFDKWGKVASKLQKRTPQFIFRQWIVILLANVIELQIELFVSKVLIVVLFNCKIMSIGKLRAGSYRRSKTKSLYAMPDYVITMLFLHF